MKEYVFSVEGMRCGMCEAHVNDAVRKVADAKKVESSHSKNTTPVVAENLDVERVKTAIAAEGYTVGEVTVKEVEKKGLFGLFQK